MELKDVKRCLRLGYNVFYKEKPYLLLGVTLRFNNTDFYYQAEIKELKINAIYIVKLEELQVKID